MSKKQQSAGSLKVNRYVLVKDEPCRIVSVDVSKSGKHGHAKVRIVCIGLFDGNKRSLTFPSHTNVEVPIIDKSTGIITSITPDSVQLMDNNTYETFELDLPTDEQLKSKLVEGATAEYWTILNKKRIMNVKGS
ncbi:MAG: translation initiation factor IF-5A [Candidatus Helarchaeota archaeon]|nr:translation initiation factor IF-5A [Candidatus Helarchaeota archaeon]